MTTIKLIGGNNNEDCMRSALSNCESKKWGLRSDRGIQVLDNCKDSIFCINVVRKLLQDIYREYYDLTYIFNRITFHCFIKNRILMLSMETRRLVRQQFK